MHDLMRRWPEVCGPVNRDLQEDTTHYHLELQKRVNYKVSSQANEKANRLCEEEEIEMVAEMTETVDIPPLPKPTVENVSEELVEKTMIPRYRRCGACKNCMKSGHTQIRCLTVAAVKEWDNQLGGVDGALVMQLCSKLSEDTWGHGMRKGIGIRCGVCRLCRWRGKRDGCLTLKCIKTGTLPERLKPAAVEASKRKRAFGGIDPYAGAKPSGIEILKQFRHVWAQKRPRHDVESEDDEEDARWGVPNMERDVRDKVWKQFKDASRGGMNRRKFRWVCHFRENAKDDYCGASNPALSTICQKCKRRRWKGYDGELQVRVSNMIETNLVPFGCEGYVEKIRENILEEHGRPDILASDDYVSVEAVKLAIEHHFVERKGQQGLLIERKDMEHTSAKQEVLETGKTLRTSRFGNAVREFDHSITELASETFGLQKDQAGAVDAPYQEAEVFSNIDDSEKKECMENFIDSMYTYIPIQHREKIPHSRHDQLKDFVRNHVICDSSLCEALAKLCKCHRFSVHMAAVYIEAGIRTSCSFLWYALNMVANRSADDTVLHQDFTKCQQCGLNHAWKIPTWRSSPSMSSFSDKNNKWKEMAWVNYNAMYRDPIIDPHVERIKTSIRYPLYSLVEETLNCVSFEKTERDIPVKHRPETERIFIEYVHIMSMASAQSLQHNSSVYLHAGPPRLHHFLIYLSVILYGLVLRPRASR